MKWQIRKENIKFSLNNKTVQIVWKVKFLGVFLDYALKWKTHVSEIRKRVLPRISVLKAIAGIKWGAHPSVLSIAYKSLVRSVLDWRSQVTSPLGDREALVLDRLQYACSRIVCGFMRTTPTNVLLDVINEHPLRSRRKYLMRKYACRVASRTDHPLNLMLSQSLSNWEPICDDNRFDLFDIFVHLAPLIQQIEPRPLPGLLAFPFNVRYFKCPVDTESGLIFRNTTSPQQAFASFLVEKRATYVFYTDGSRIPPSGSSPARVGYSMVSEYPDMTHYSRINNHSSVFDAEARGVLCALEYISDFEFGQSYVATDSLSVLRCLDSFDPQGSHPTDIYKIKTLTLELLARKARVEFLWVPAHKNIRGNKMADQYAKKALDMPEPNSSETCSARSVFPSLRAMAVEESTAFLTTEARYKGLRYFRLKGKVLGKPWYEDGLVYMKT
ncbi:uncharacterized protein LOC109862299 [Pseudomyrmex gracilis]|uniref:uncharacterized protein LOC109862299 n=1 Tax=Pseudomyrmex gracilis TaxID=219809 RepID=UPI000994C488|nr:uncharacterized protein LOC109862299 [Pseudomyrmex gracilis]